MWVLADEFRIGENGKHSSGIDAIYRKTCELGSGLA